MDKEFERRMMLAANPRARKRNRKQPEKFVRPKTHVGALLRDLMADDPDMPRGGGHICDHHTPLAEKAARGVK